MRLLKRRGEISTFAGGGDSQAAAPTGTAVRLAWPRDVGRGRTGFSLRRGASCNRPTARILLVLLQASLVTGLAAYLLVLGLEAFHAGPGAKAPHELLGAVLVLAAVRCLLRAAFVAEQRLAWLAIGAGLLSWGGGEALLSVTPSLLASPGSLSLADMATLVFYPMAGIGLVLLLRAAVPRFSALLWLDGLAGALAVSAVVATFAFAPVLAGAGNSLGSVSAAMSYPFADLMLIAVVVFALAMTGWRPGLSLGLVTAALVLIFIVDGFSMWWTSTGHTGAITPFNALWPLAAVLVATAAGREPITATVGTLQSGIRSLLFPVGFSLIALGLLLFGLAHSLDAAGYELSTAALAFLVIRMALTAIDNLAMARASRREALTDALTDLGNRRKLMIDLEHATATARPESPALLLLFDLDGFKLYNDTFGHPAGDALLARLGGALREAVTPTGQVYRLGGDEFCALFVNAARNATTQIPAILRALSEHGEGFTVTASLGSVLIPTDAPDPTLALQLADQRLYLRKGERHREMDSEQASEVLKQALRERGTGLPEHLSQVATLARALARQYDISSEEIEQITRAAELHDIGKMAVPETVLEKPGPLDSNETELMHQHTVIGERILAAAPALRPVGALVRSSHEHYDGTGYPDGLAGQEIPLASRIIAVCDAYEAMIGGRPYRAAISHDETIAELRRCAGTQFDPEVVERFCKIVLATSSEAPAAARADT